MPETLSQYWENKLIKKLLRCVKASFTTRLRRTLAPFVNRPKDAVPSPELKEQVKKLASHKSNQIIIISGRSKDDIGEWFKDIPITLVVEHGGFVRPAGQDNWESTKDSDNSWKPQILNIFEKGRIRHCWFIC